MYLKEFLTHSVICNVWSGIRHFSPKVPDRYLKLGSKGDHQAAITYGLGPDISLCRCLTGIYTFVALFSSWFLGNAVLWVFIRLSLYWSILSYHVYENNRFLFSIAILSERDHFTMGISFLEWFCAKRLIIMAPIVQKCLLDNHFHPIFCLYLWLQWKINLVSTKTKKKEWHGRSSLHILVLFSKCCSTFNAILNAVHLQRN